MMIVTGDLAFFHQQRRAFTFAAMILSLKRVDLMQWLLVFGRGSIHRVMPTSASLDTGKYAILFIAWDWN